MLEQPKSVEFELKFPYVLCIFELKFDSFFCQWLEFICGDGVVEPRESAHYRLGFCLCFFLFIFVISRRDYTVRKIDSKSSFGSFILCFGKEFYFTIGGRIICAAPPSDSPCGSSRSKIPFQPHCGKSI